MERECSKRGREDECIRGLVGIPEGWRPLRKHRGEGDNIKTDLRERVWGSIDWFHLTQDRDK
jgi:hypothetical protein